MTLTHEEWKQKYEQETLEFHKIDRWHKMGLKGKGAKILNLEGYCQHGKDTYDVIRFLGPEEQIDWVEMGYASKANKLYKFHAFVDETNILEYDENGDGELNLEEFKEFINQYDVITVSMSGSFPEEVEEAFVDCGAILMSSAGNDGEAGVTGRFKDIGWSVGAIYIKDGQIKKETYSAIGPEVDFACLHCEKDGTSFSSPALAAICGLIIGRYGKLDQEEMEEVLKKISLDPGEPGYDTWYGWGVPILPERINSMEINRNRLYSIDEVLSIIKRYPKKELHIHHTWKPNIKDFSGSNHAALQEGMRNYHINNRGFVDIAQHLTLFPDGVFLIGRDLNIAPNSSSGHRDDGSSWNKDFVLMVETIGNFDQEYIPSDVWTALVKLAAEIKLEGGEVLFHREMDSRKSCPGNLFIKENFMKEVKLEVVQMAVDRVFKDLDPADWSNDDVKWCKEKGILNGSLEDIDGDGIKDEVVHPDAMIKRKEVAAVIHRAFDVLKDDIVEEVKKLI